MPRGCRSVAREQLRQVAVHVGVKAVPPAWISQRSSSEAGSGLGQAEAWAAQTGPGCQGGPAAYGMAHQMLRLPRSQEQTGKHSLKEFPLVPGVCALTLPAEGAKSPGMGVPARSGLCSSASSHTSPRGRASSGHLPLTVQLRAQTAHKLVAPLLPEPLSVSCGRSSCSRSPRPARCWSLPPLPQPPPPVRLGVHPLTLPVSLAVADPGHRATPSSPNTSRGPWHWACSAQGHCGCGGL